MGPKADPASGGSGGTTKVTVINTGNLSHVKQFNLGDDWEIFSERLEQSLVANMVEEERKVAILLTSIGEEVYKILRDVCDPVKGKEKSFSELLQLLDVQFKAKVSVYRKRIEFDLLRQTNETIAEWFVKVKNAAAACSFGRNLDDRVKDKFVVGLKPGLILDRLCEESLDKSLQDLYELAVTKEAALRQTRHEVGIHRVVKFQEKKEGKARPEGEKRCYHCNKGNHNFKNCKFKSYVCAKCKTRGHIAAACKSKIVRNHCVS